MNSDCVSMLEEYGRLKKDAFVLDHWRMVFPQATKTDQVQLEVVCCVNVSWFVKWFSEKL